MKWVVTFDTEFRGEQKVIVTAGHVAEAEDKGYRHMGEIEEERSLLSDYPYFGKLERLEVHLLETCEGCGGHRVKNAPKGEGRV